MNEADIVLAIVGNGANQVLATQAFFDDVYKVKTPYSALAQKYYNHEAPFPFWDETAIFSVLDPANILNSTSCKCDIVC